MEPTPTVWIGVRHGVEALGEGPRTWGSPPVVRKALGELLGALPATHVELDLAAVAELEGVGWAAVVDRAAPAAVLGELTQAVASAVEGRAVWGLRLPGPATVAAAQGDPSERGAVKAGVRLASFLQGFREAGVAFVALELVSTEEKAAASLLRNAALYRWKRMRVVAGASPLERGGLDGVLAAEASIEELAPLWRAGQMIAGGLGERFWKGGALEGGDPGSAHLYGAVPPALEPAALVDAGRRLRAWLS